MSSLHLLLSTQDAAASLSEVCSSAAAYIIQLKVVFPTLFLFYMHEYFSHYFTIKCLTAETEKYINDDLGPSVSCLTTCCLWYRFQLPIDTGIYIHSQENFRFNRCKLLEQKQKSGRNGAGTRCRKWT